MELDCSAASVIRIGEESVVPSGVQSQVPTVPLCSSEVWAKSPYIGGRRHSRTHGEPTVLGDVREGPECPSVSEHPAGLGRPEHERARRLVGSALVGALLMKAGSPASVTTSRITSAAPALITPPTTSIPS